MQIESFDHGGVPGDYRNYSIGGYALSQATLTYLSHAQALRFVCQSAFYPVYRDYVVNFPANRKLRFQVPMQKDFSGGTMKIQIIDPANDPLRAPGSAVLAETSKADITGTWEVVEVAYTSTYARPLIVRIIAMVASGNAYFDTTWMENRFCGVLPVIGTPVIQSRSDES
jgi:hypothetical protein